MDGADGGEDGAHKGLKASPLSLALEQQNLKSLCPHPG